MGHRLKPIEDQVIVITGASSGIGLVTARMAARRGARLVLAARSEAALRDLAEEINSAGGEALAVTCDVTHQQEIHRVTEAAIDRFGGFDTWVNDAGVGMFGKILDVPVDDMRRLFETNLWGLVRGSIEAANHFRQRQDQRFDGAIINVGSVLSYQAIPLQGPYVASKHAVKGFTDSLRIELEHDGLPVSVTCIMPNAIDTPYGEHAPNYMDVEPTLPPPLYAPETVARAILHAAANPTRELTVGGAFKPVTALRNIFPGFVDSLMGTVLSKAQRREDQPVGRPQQKALTRPSGATEEGAFRENSEEDRFSLPFSAYTEAKMHPWTTIAVVAGAGLLIGAAMKNLSDGD